MKPIRFFSFLVALMIVFGCMSDKQQAVADVSEVTINGAVGKLVGNVSRPFVSEGEQVPLVIICHGLGSRRHRPLLDLTAQSLLKYGIGSVQFDFNGHGESDGRFMDHSIDLEVQDLDSIYAFVSQLPWVDNSRISLMGHSQGGAVVGMYAGLNPEKIHSLVLSAPGGGVIHDFALSLAEKEVPDSAMILPKLWIGRGYIESAIKNDIPEITSRYHGPSCLLQGDNDALVPYQYSIKLHEMMPENELHMFDALTHSYEKDITSPVTTAVTFLVKTLKPTRGIGRVYVSSSKGDDSNSGKSRFKPVKTISRAVELGDDIRLRRGDWFYEILDMEGVSIKAYGPGSQKPVVSGFRKLAAGQTGKDGSSVWERGAFDSEGWWHADENGDVYRLNMYAEGIFGGFNDNRPLNFGNIGTIYDPAQDRMYGRKCQAPTEEAYMALSYRTGNSYKFLERDMDFYQAPHHEPGCHSFQYLYVKASDPAMLRDRELWFSIGANCIRGNNKTIADIKVLGWGYHGAKVFDNVSILNCEFDIIGGSLLVTYPRWVRFGNGAEFWATSSRNGLVQMCTFSRVYDTATTIQGPMDKSQESYCENIIFRDNVMRNCRQDFEVWIRTTDGTMPQNCEFTGNVGYDAGDNGFESTEINGTHYLHYANAYKISGIKVENNEFHDGGGVMFSTKLDFLPTGPTTYYCDLGAPVLKGGKGVRINAPVLQDGKYSYASAIEEDGTVVMSSSDSLKEALEGVQKLLGDLTGNYEFKIIINKSLCLKPK